MIKSKIFIVPTIAFQLALATAALAQTTYYVSNDGNDSNAGTSASAPFKTIGKVNQLTLQPGDVINFKRGDSFSGQINVKQSGTAAKPICIDAYGSGNKPIIEGSVPVTGWKQKSGNVWVASLSNFSGTDIDLYSNNQPLPLGRYPNLSEANKGYLTITSHVGKTGLTSQQALNTDFTGGEVVVRQRLWQIDAVKILSQQGNSLTFDKVTEVINDKWGFFIQNHPATLDQDGEWYYDAQAKQIQLYSTGNPDSKGIEASIYGAGVNLASVSNIKIQNINFIEQRLSGINAKSVRNLVISNNVISKASRDGINISGSGSGVTITGNTISDAYNNAIVVYDHDNINISNNNISDIGLVRGRGTNSAGSSVGIRYNAQKNGGGIIANNGIENTGYSGIDFRSANITIQKNLIKNVNLIKSDGGGIYTFTGKNANNFKNQKIVSNIVLNSIGSYEGSSDAHPNAHGIYLDDRSHDIDVTNNTVANCTGSGIFMNATTNVVLDGNILYNNANQLQMNYTKSGGENVNTTIERNVLAGKAKQSISRNRSRLLTTAAKLTNTNKTVADADDNNTRFEYNATGAAKTVTLDGTYRDADNKTYAGKVTLQPFSSVVLMK